MTYLIWSNQKGMWWGPNSRGYTRWIDEAGRYDEAEARRIVADATVDGKLTHRVDSYLYGTELSVVDEVLVPAPEAVTP
jgi:hypothetical protein